MNIFYRVQNICVGLSFLFVLTACSTIQSTSVEDIDEMSSSDSAYPSSSIPRIIYVSGVTDLSDATDLSVVTGLSGSKGLISVRYPPHTGNLGTIHAGNNISIGINQINTIPAHLRAVVRVLYATDRNQTTSKLPTKKFGEQRSPHLSYGWADVSIPSTHKAGELESPSIFRFRPNSSDDSKYIVLKQTEISSEKDFFINLGKMVKASKKSNAFVFIHGYNVSFEDAARRTAQLSYDLHFDGAPVFYSWPSNGKTLAYTYDEANIEWAEYSLRIFLERFFSESKAENIYLIAHSMGNRALTRVIASIMEDKPKLRKRIKEIILTAPDIDAQVFKRAIAPRLTKAGRPVTLYTSNEDKALFLSKGIHAYPRAGDSGEDMIILPGIETIDASGINSGFLKHSYFAESDPVLNDMFYLINRGNRANDRKLRGVDTKNGRYWSFDSR